METHKIATLIWRFVGIYGLLGGLLGMGTLMLLSRGHAGHPLALLLLAGEIVLGALVLQFSKRLGEIIASGL